MRAVVAVVFAGCGFAPTLSGDGSVGDDGSDSGMACAQWHAHHFDACKIPQPTGDITLAGAPSPLVFDTTTETLKDNTGTVIPIVAGDYHQTDGVVACVWSMQKFSLDAAIELDVIGDKPLIIAAWDTMAIRGRVDASS